MKYAFDVFADYNQFLVLDKGADWGDLASRWTDSSVEEMFVQGDRYIAVGTARPAEVPVEVRVERAEPELVDRTYDRMATGTLKLLSGQLVVMGTTDNGRSGGQVPVPPGEYRVRVLYSGLGELSEDGLDGNDSYVIEVWPG